MPAAAAVGGGEGAGGGGEGVGVGEGAGVGGGSSACRLAHWPSALPSTLLAVPVGAGEFEAQRKLSSMELPEISTPPVLRIGFTFAPKSLLSSSSRVRLAVRSTSRSTSVSWIVLMSPTSSSSFTFPSMRLRSMSTKSARSPSRSPLIRASRALKDPPANSLTLPRTSVPLSVHPPTTFRSPSTVTSPSSPRQMTFCAAAWVA
jgi:hypothetical protein